MGRTKQGQEEANGFMEMVVRGLSQGELSGTDAREGNRTIGAGVFAGARRLFRGHWVFSGEEDSERRLDEEVATRVLGYRWVQWNPREGAMPPSDEKGRFLAPSDGLLSHHQVPAGRSVPPAQEPYRYVPRFSSEIESALEAAQAVGLLRHDNATLELSEQGEWTIRTKGDRLAITAPTLPEALCRAALRWREIEDGARLALEEAKAG